MYSTKKEALGPLHTSSYRCKDTLLLLIITIKSKKNGRRHCSGHSFMYLLLLIAKIAQHACSIAAAKFT